MSSQKPSAAEELNRRRMQSLNERRNYIKNCPTCEDIKENHGGFGPPHDASPRCESGFYEHCTCDTCF